MIEKVQERGLRFVYNDSVSSYEQLLCMSNNSTMYTDRLRNIAIQVYKIMNNLCPSYLNDMCIMKTNGYDLRNKIQLIQPKVNTVTYGIFSFRYHGAKIWNLLPDHVKMAPKLDTFKVLLSQWHKSLCNCSFCARCLL